jgi:hypothetical protein
VLKPIVLFESLARQSPLELRPFLRQEFCNVNRTRGIAHWLL